MNLERGQLLRDVLGRVERGETELGFGMRDWHCGTAACAGGHLAMDPRAQVEGLGLVPMYGAAAMLEVKFGDEYGFHALATYLGISVDQSFQLFDGVNYGDFDADNPDDSLTPGHIIARLDGMMSRPAVAPRQERRPAKGEKRSSRVPPRRPAPKRTPKRKARRA